MRFQATALAGVQLVETDLRGDERGHFARTFDVDAFAAHGTPFSVVQASYSFNDRAGTLRGMHLQSRPHGERKLIRCGRGAIFDVVVDPATREWLGVTLRAGDGRLLLVDRELAHGFQTLEDGSEVHYMMDAPYVPEAATGFRWDDPAFGIAWPDAPPAGRTVSDRDASWPLL